MTGNHLLSQMGRQMFRGTSLLLKHGDIITLCALRTLLPPQTERRHVVCGDCGHAAIRIAIEVSELIAALLGHRLDLERQDAETVKHRCHTIGQHPQILSTTEHTRITKDIRQTVHRLVTPEEVMTLEEIVIIESQESILLLIVQSLIDGFVEDTDTWMVHLWLLRILEEEHITDKAIKAIANPQAVLIVFPLEEIAHLLLRIKLSLQVVESIAARNQEIITNIRCMHTKKSLKHTIVDKRTCEEILAERQTKILYLAHRHRKGWREMPQQSEDSIQWNLPDTEEAQYMVDTDGIEILLHPAQTLVEPFHQRQLFCFHFSFLTPVVGGESPVLAIEREVIRWCTRLGIKMEELRMSSSLYTLTIDTDGDITLDEDPFLTSIVSCRLQLEMEVILEEINLLSRIRWTSNPLGIRFEPILIFSKPLFEFFRIERLLSLFLKEFADIS